MRFQDIVMVAATQPVVAAGGGSHASWPLTGMGVEADWAFVGGAISWNAGLNQIDWDNPADTDTASLTGTAKTSFDAAVSANTACNFTFTSPGGEGSNMQFRARGGSWTNLVMDGSTGPFVVPCTSGSGSGFDLRGVVGGSGGADGLVNIQIALA